MSDYFESVEISALRPMVAFNYTDLNVNVLDYYILTSVREFASRSKSIKRTLHIDGQKGVEEYILSIEDDYVVMEIISVKIDGRCIEKSCSKCECTDGTFKYRSGLITLCNFKGCDIDVEIIASPSVSSCRVDADIVNLWGHVIANGVNSKLMLSNDKRWRNKGVANSELKLFLLGCEEAMEVAQREGISDKVYHVETIRANQTHNPYTGRDC